MAVPGDRKSGEGEESITRECANRYLDLCVPPEETSLSTVTLLTE